MQALQGRYRPRSCRDFAPASRLHLALIMMDLVLFIEVRNIEPKLLSERAVACVLP